MKLLLTGAFKYTDEQLKYLKSIGHKIIFFQDEREKINFDASDIDGVICNGLFLYNDIKQFTSLKYIQLTSAGLDRVPLDYINEHNIKIYNARGVYSIPMAEFAITGVLQLYKQSKFFYKNQIKHTWIKNRNLAELSGKTVCVVGAGSVGQAVAKLFSAFNCKVIGVDPIATEVNVFDEMLDPNDIDEVLPDTDILILTLPLTEDNEGFFDIDKFNKMKNSSVFVNIARGKLVNEKDLISALELNVISGAVLDVFEDEPLDNQSPLWDFENVIITPHNSFVGENNNSRLFEVIITNLNTIK